MVLLTTAQQAEYAERGFIVLRNFPEIAPLTSRMVEAYQSVAKATLDWEDDTAPTNKFRTQPIVPGSYWSILDHSLPFLQVILHPHCLELAKQQLGTDDIYLRNAGVNENAPGYSVFWHRDSVDQFWNGEPTWMEFMQLPFADGRGCSAERGTLRFIPGSHGWDREQHAAFEAELASRREAQGIPANGHEQADVEMPGEVTVEVGPNDIILRESTIYHASHSNSTTDGRLMQHWLFRAASHSPNNHRMRWDECLSLDLKERLLPIQRAALWLGREYDLDPRYEKEQAREGNGKVCWDTLDEHVSQAKL